MMTQSIGVHQVRNEGININSVVSFGGQCLTEVGNNLDVVVKNLSSLLGSPMECREVVAIRETYQKGHVELGRLTSQISQLEIELGKLGLKEKALAIEIGKLRTYDTIVEIMKQMEKALTPGKGYVRPLTWFYESIVPLNLRVVRVISIGREFLDRNRRKKEQLSNELNDVTNNIASKAEELKDFRIFVCKVVGNNIQTLAELIDCVVLKLTQKDEKLKGELVNMTREFNQIFNNLERLKVEVKALEVQLSGLSSQKEQLKSQINEINKKIAEIEKKIEKEEDKRQDAWTDLIPGVGFIGALVTKRYTRMIPLYSPISGIVSVAKQTLENETRKLKLQQKEEEQLNSQLNNVTLEIQTKNYKINQINQDLCKLNLRKQAKEIEIRELGRDITYLKDVNLCVKAYLEKCKLLGGDVETAQTLVEIDMAEQGEMEDLLGKLEEVERVFSSLLWPEKGIC